MSAESRRAERLLALTERLTAVLKDDIAALERGRPRDMRSPGAEAQQLIQHYRSETQGFNPATAQGLSLVERAQLNEATARFREVVALHARVVARVKTCSEGMIRAIADDVAKKRAAQRPYSAPTMPAQSPRTPGAIVYNSVV
jgi:hypothetical protein